MHFPEPKLKATLYLHPNDDDLVLGKDYELQCKPELDIPGMDIDRSKLKYAYKWYKKGEPTDIKEKKFSLESFKFSNAGRYTCTVTVKSDLLDSPLELTEEIDVKPRLGKTL